MSAFVASADQPLVSVVMIAYNVERYVGQAIESVLSQDAPFSYELVIGEDCSTDSTRQIIQEYAARNPGVVRPLYRSRNLGMNANFFATYAKCRGTYVALLDGDDYWTAPQKLRMQVEFLERNRDYSLCFHNVMVVYDDDAEQPHLFHVTQPGPRLSTSIPSATSGLRELAGGNFIQTASVMYRSALAGMPPAWVLQMPTFDWPLHVLHAEKGHIGYLDRTMAVYRVHRGGMWSSGLSYYRSTAEIARMIEAFALVDRHVSGRYRSAMAAPLAFLHERAMTVARESGDHASAVRYARAVLARSLRRQQVRRGAHAAGVMLRAGGALASAATRAAWRAILWRPGPGDRRGQP